MKRQTSNDAGKRAAAVQAKTPDAAGLKWYAPAEPPLQLCGFAWYESDRVYRRLPVHPPKPLPKAVDELADCTAGGQVRFQTNSRRVVVKVALAGPSGMVHMPPTGQCGFDSYVGDPARDRPRFCLVTKYDPTQSAYECDLGTFVDSGMRTITLNFPLYQGVKQALIGLDADARVLPPPPFRTPGRVIVYGTSITQGGCATRPGMAYTNILSRWLNVEFINLGFSGSGRGEPEVAEIIARIERPACYVLDYEGNVENEQLVRATLPEFIRILRSAHAHTPIVAVSRILFSSDLAPISGRRDLVEVREAQREIVARLRRQGDRHVHFVSGAGLLGKDADECTVDGVHPTDLGFLRMAERLAPVLRRLL